MFSFMSCRGHSVSLQQSTDKDKGYAQSLYGSPMLDYHTVTGLYRKGPSFSLPVPPLLFEPAPPRGVLLLLKTPEVCLTVDCSVVTLAIRVLRSNSSSAHCIFNDF